MIYFLGDTLKRLPTLLLVYELTSSGVTLGIIPIERIAALCPIVDRTAAEVITSVFSHIDGSFC